MSQTGTKIIQILGIVAFLILALSLLMNWRMHKQVHEFHEKHFAHLKNEMKIGMTQEEVRAKLKDTEFRIEEKTATRWTVRWFNADSKEAAQIQTDRLGIPTSAELQFDEHGTLLELNGVK